MKKLWIMLAAVLAIVALAGLFIMVQDDGAEVETNTTPQNTTANEAQQDQSQGEAAASTIVYTNSGFQNSSYTVRAGESVTVTNNSDSVLDFASDEHPTHTDNSELNAGSISPGGSRTFTLQTPGSWGVHNHENDAHTTTVIVE